MNQDDYKQTLDRLNEEWRDLHDRRINLETELNDLNSQIQHLDEVIDHLRPLAGVPEGDNVRGLGITDAIRVVLKKADGNLSAPEIREALVKHGFDLSRYTAPMSSIYKILARLADANPPEVDRVKIDGRPGIAYQWAQIEITDDDIPF